MDRNQDWDIIVVGTGLGGAPLGYQLAKAGRRVLFLEKGRSHFADHAALRGGFAETFFAHCEAPAPKHAEILARAGRWTDVIEDRSGRRPQRHIPFVGSGTGGSSALYGMAMERLWPQDFTPRRVHPDTASTLPDAWPITYDDLWPHYRAAEALFRVRGSVDPLHAAACDPLLDPPPLSGAAAEMRTFLEQQGLHPYHLPSACERVAQCQGCQGYLCPLACKNDSARVALVPALEEHGAELWDQCQVLRLEATRTAVTGVVCRYRGEQRALRARTVVLAAGALETPCLLRRSRSAAWPQGLANASGLVGRNLMRHYVDLWAVFTHDREGCGSGIKELAFNDLYLDAAGKFGTVQSFGALPPAPVIVAGMEEDLHRKGLGWVRPGFRLAQPLLRAFLARQFSRALLMASIIEDLPYPDNRVEPADERTGIALSYRIRPEEAARIDAVRRRIARLLKPYRVMLLKQAENNQRIAHACGTCRFGTDPRDSVLDAHNKAHGLDNLYVVDASFFPSSGGTNPGLTIAANALRVAGHLIDAQAATGSTR